MKKSVRPVTMVQGVWCTRLQGLSGPEKAYQKTVLSGLPLYKCRLESLV